MRISDTCGVHNLHGMPAVFSAICSAIFASLATVENYKGSLTEIFPAMKQINMTMDESEMHEEMHMVIGGYGRTATYQGAYQLLAILITLAVAIVGGLITGLILKSPSLRKLTRDELHCDEAYWEVPEEKSA